MVIGWFVFGFGSLLVLADATLAVEDEKPSESIQMVIDLIGEKDKEFRAAGLDQVRTGAAGTGTSGTGATKLFAAQLVKLGASAQVDLLGALADRGDAVARPAVIGLLASSPDANVRAAAILALGKLGEPADLPLLVKSLSAGSDAEQYAARWSLTQLRGEAVSDALAADLKTAAPSVKAALIEALAARRASGAAPAFVAASVDDSAQVRGAAMAALGELGGPEQIAAMLPGVLKAEKGAERDAAEKNVALVCSRIEDEDRRAGALIKALDGVKPAQRDQLLSLVGRVGGKKLISFVADIATGKDVSRRRLGIDALSKWPDASVADKLLDVANHATDPAERSQAFQGYVKISATRDSRTDRQRLDRMREAIKMAKTPEEQALVINRARTAYDVDTLRFVLPFVDQPPFAKVACETIVELAHHREIRDPNKAEFDKALDEVIKISKDPTVIDRAERYKKGETWSKPAK
jgi:hypothetical protein